MIIPFNKYQGAGNDFVIIDNRKGIFNPTDNALIKNLCDHRFGIGADGLILISSLEGFDYEMKYFNSDGNEGSMCGNGGRCAADFALTEGIACKDQRFKTFDGTHEAEVGKHLVRLKMNDVEGIRLIDNNYFINTGSPHYIVFVDDAQKTDVFNEGRKLRYLDKFAPGGTNVNFVEIIDSGIYVRTYERGVEDETLSCGTGVTASAIAAFLSGFYDKNIIDVKTKGGDLSVEFKGEENKITDIWLTGPATFVFKGEIEV